MAKNPVTKKIEKAFAAQAAALPLRPVDEGALQREVDAHKARVAERERRQAEMAATVVVPGEAQPIAALLPALQQSMEKMRAKAQPTEEDLRRWTLERELLPRLEAWGFESRFRREITDWKCPEQEATFRVCQQKLRGVGAVVALIGRRGAGKTTIAAQLALAAARREHAGRREGRPGLIVTFVYRKVTTLVCRFKPLYANFGSMDTEVLTRALMVLGSVETDVLVIDEMHDLSELAVREAMLIDLIDRRYAAQRDTILISNQTPEEWDAQTPVSIQSRIQEHGCILTCEWESWREKG